MAVTRIKNNQITDKAITYAKIADTTITGGQLASDLVYASNLTVQGNLTVSGNTTVVDSTNTTVADPLTLLASGLSGSPSNDVGFLINRGSSVKQAIVWNEANNEFAVFSTTATTGSTGSINNSGYSDFKAGALKAGNLSMSGNAVTSTGDDLYLTAASGNVIATNMTISSLTADRVPYVGANGYISTTSYLTFDPVTGDFYANTVAGGNLKMAGNTLSSTDTDGNINISPNGAGLTKISNLSVTGLAANSVIVVDANGTFTTDGEFTFDGTTNEMVLNGTANIGNLSIHDNTIESIDTNGNIELTPNGTGKVVASNVQITDGTMENVVIGGTTAADASFVTANAANAYVSSLTMDRVTYAGASGLLKDSANLTFNGTKLGTVDLEVSGNISSTNLKATGLTQDRVLLAGTSGAIVDSGNLTFSGTVLTVTGNVSATNLAASANIGTANLKITGINQNKVLYTTTGGNVTSGNLEYNGTTLDVGAAGNVSAGNVTAAYIESSGNANAVTFNGNLVGTNANISGTANVGNLDVSGSFNVVDLGASGNITANGTIDATGNLSGGNISTAGSLSVTGNANVGNLGTNGDISANNISATNNANAVTFNGNLEASYANISGSANATTFNGNLEATTANITGNIDAGNVTTGGEVVATGNVSGGNLTTLGNVTGNNIIATNNANATTFNGNLNGNSSTVTGNSNASIFNGNLKGSTANLTGNVDGGNLNTTGAVSATGNVSGGNLTTLGEVSGNNAVFGTTANAATFNGNLNGDSSTVTGNSNAAIFNGNLVASYANISGNINAGNANIDGLFANFANISGNVDAGNANLSGEVKAGSANVSGTVVAGNATVSSLTSGRVVLAGTSGALVDSGNLTFNGTELSVTGNVKASNANIANIEITPNTITNTELNSNLVFATSGTGVFDFSGTVIGNVSDPSSLQDVVTVSYLNTQLSSAITQITEGDSSVAVTDTGTGNIVTTVDGTVVSYALAGGTTFAGNVTVNNVSISGNTITTLAGTGEALNLDSDTGVIHMNGDVEITGNLQIGGDQTIVDVTNLAITDPVINVGTNVGNSPLTTDDGYDRGLQLHYYHSSDKHAALIMANQDDKLYFYKDATETGGQYSGTLGNVVAAGFEGNTITVTGNANVGAVNSTGDVSGNNVVATNNSNANVFNGNTMEIALTANVTGNLTAGNISTGGDANVTGTVTAGNVEVSSLTNGRVTFAGTNGQLIDEAGFEYNSSTDELTVGNANVSGAIVAGNITDSGLTSGRVTFAGTGGLLSDASTFTFDTIGNELTVTNANVTGNLTVGGTFDLGLTQGYVTFGGVNGELAQHSNFSYDDTLHILTVNEISANGNVTAGGFLDNSLTDLGAIVFAGTSGKLVSDNTFTYDDPTSTLGVVNGNISGNLTIGGTLNAGLTSSYVQFGGASGEFAEDAGFTFNTASQELAVGNANVSGTVVAGGIKDSALTSGRVVYSTTNGELTDATTFTFDDVTSTLTVTNANITGNLTAGNLDLGLTQNYVTFGSPIGALTEDAGFTFDPTVGQLAVGNANVSGTIIAGHIKDSALTAGRVVYTTTDGELFDASNFTYATDTLSVDNANIAYQLTANTLSVTNNANVGNLGTAGFITANGNITGGNLSTAGELVVTGNANVGAVNAGGGVFSGNVEAANFSTIGNANATTFNGSSANLSGNLGADYVNANVNGTYGTFSSLTQGQVVFADTGGQLETDGNLSYNVSSSELTLHGTANIDGTLTVSSTANVGSLVVGDLSQYSVLVAGVNGQVTDPSNFTYDDASSTVTVNGNIDVGNLELRDNTLSSTDTNGNIYITPDGTGQTIIKNASLGGYTGSRVLVTDSMGEVTTDGDMTWDSGTNILGINGTANIAGNLIVANLSLYSNDVTSLSGNINITPNGTDSTVVKNLVSDNVAITGGSINNTAIGGSTASTGAFTDLSASGNANLGNTFVSTLTSGRVVVAGASGQLGDFADFTFDGSDLTVTGNIYVGNLRISGNDITAQTGGEVTFNAAQSNIDFNIAGSADANLFFVSAGQNNIGINTNTPNTEAKLHIVSTDSIIIPIGADGDRPISPTAGMVRFNTSQNQFEGYNGTAWQSFSSASTVITSETFQGNGVDVEFTLGQELTTAAAMVAVNGVMQIPSTAYSISGTTLTFTEAPAYGDVIEVRQLATTSTVNVTLQSPNGFDLVEATNSGITIYTGTSSAAARWRVGTDGHFVPGTDNTLHIGAVGNAVRNVYYSGALVSSRTAGTVGTSATTIDSFSAGTYRTAKYVIQVANSGGTAFDCMEAMVIHDGTTAYLTVSNQISTGSELGTLSVDLTSGTVALKYTGVGSNNVVKLGKSYITA